MLRMSPNSPSVDSLLFSIPPPEDRIDAGTRINIDVGG